MRDSVVAVDPGTDYAASELRQQQRAAAAGSEWRRPRLETHSTFATHTPGGLNG